MSSSSKLFPVEHAFQHFSSKLTAPICNVGFESIGKVCKAGKTLHEEAAAQPAGILDDFTLRNVNECGKEDRNCILRT